jgi:hypothetical protein
MFVSLPHCSEGLSLPKILNNINPFVLCGQL